MDTQEFAPMNTTNDTVLEYLKHQKIQGAIIDSSGSELKFTLLCNDEPLTNVTSDQLRVLHSIGKLPNGLTEYLLQRGIID